MSLNAQAVWSQPKVVIQDSLFIMGNSCATDNGLMTVFVRLQSQLENQVICRTNDLNGNLLNEIPLTFIDSQTHVSSVQMCKTTNNDYIIIWCQREFGRTYTIRAMKINSNAEAQWSSAPICGSMPIDTYSQFIKVIADQEGGAYVVWSNNNSEFFYNQIRSDASIVNYTSIPLGEFSYMYSFQYYVFNHRLYLIMPNGIFVSPYQDFQSYYINLYNYNDFFQDLIVFDDAAYLLSESHLLKLNLQNFQISVLENSQESYFGMDKISEDEFVIFKNDNNMTCSAKHYDSSGTLVSSYQNSFLTQIISLKDDSSYRFGDNLYFTKNITDHLDDFTMPYLYLFKYNVITHELDYQCLYSPSFSFTNNQYGPYTAFTGQQLAYYSSTNTISGLKLTYNYVNLNNMVQNANSQLTIDLNINHLKQFKSLRHNNQMISLIEGSKKSKLLSFDDQLSTSSIDYNSSSFVFQKSYIAPTDNNHLLSVISMYDAYPGTGYLYINILDPELQSVSEIPDNDNIYAIPVFGTNEDQHILISQQNEIIKFYNLSSDFTLLSSITSNHLQNSIFYAFRDNFLLYYKNNIFSLTHFTDQFEIDPLWGQEGVPLTQMTSNYQLTEFSIDRWNNLLLISYIEYGSTQMILHLITFDINTRQVLDTQSIPYNTQMSVKKIIHNNYLYLGYTEASNNSLKIQCFSINQNGISEEWTQILIPYHVYEFDMKLVNQRLLCAVVLKNNGGNTIALKTLSLTGGPDQFEYPYHLNSLYLFSSNVEIIPDNNQAYINRLESRDTFNVSLVTDLIDMSQFLTTEDPVIQPEQKFSINNYPNPFNPSTSLSYTLDRESRVSIEIFNVKGQKVKTLINDVKPIGNHSVEWNGTDQNGNSCSSGIYFYKFISEDHQVTKKMLMVK